MRKKGIAFKTFIFTSLLITFVVLISFGIFYLILPDYYLFLKERSLNKNAQLLTNSISQTDDADEIRVLLKDFSLENNVNVISMDVNNNVVVELSYPFFMIDESLAVQIVRMEPQENESINPNFIENRRFITRLENRIATSPSGENQEKLDIFMPLSKGRTHIAIRSGEANATLLMNKSVQNNLLSEIIISGTLQPIDEAKNVVVSLIPYLIVFNILVSVLASFLYSKMLTKPILKISQTAELMHQLQPNVLSDINTKDEIGVLSKNLDSLYIKLCDNIKNLESEMKKVSRLEEAKADFMRSASHELKTPLTALNGFVEGMIDKVGVYKDTDKYLVESKRLIDKLSLLVNEILEASHIEEGNLVNEKIDLVKLIESLLDEYKIFILEKKLNLTFEESCLNVFYDKKRLYLTLSNIISNAVKYTNAEGNINILFSHSSQDTVVLSIENQFTQVSNNELEKLFEPFYILNYSRDKNKSGTGLGLYIVKKNLERLKIPYDFVNSEVGLKFNLYLNKYTF